jgi:NTP pyrophosphatase (non-canonical NTP hydrolase)
MNDLVKQVEEWGASRGLIGPFGKATIDGQINKLQEEFEELVTAVHEDDFAEIKDAIGDMTVVLTLLTRLVGLAYDEPDLDLTECYQGAYDVISKRTGKMVNGQFQKDK